MPPMPLFYVRIPAKSNHGVRQVGAAVPAFALSDLDSAVSGRIPNKQAAKFLPAGLLKDGARLPSSGPGTP